MTSTETLQKPDEQTVDRSTDDGPKMFHYVRKAKIAESAVMGNMVVALCGETFPVTKSAKPGSPVCPRSTVRSSRPRGASSRATCASASSIAR